MLLGASTSIYWDYKKHDVAQAVNHMVEKMGFECIEILCEHPFYRYWATDRSVEERERLKKILSEYDLKASVHAPYHDLNIASLNPGIRAETLKQLKEAINTARELNAEVVVIHPGYVASRKYPRELAFKAMIENLRELVEYAEKEGVVLCLENLASKSKALCVSYEEILKVLAAVSSRHLRVTLDIAHANTIGREAPVVFIRELGGLIKHVHVSDNTGENQHLPIGMGNINFEAVLRELKGAGYSGFLVLEGWIPGDPDFFVQWSKDRLKELLEIV